MGLLGGNDCSARCIAASGSASAPLHIAARDFRAWRLPAYRDYNAEAADIRGGCHEFRGDWTSAGGKPAQDKDWGWR